MEIPLKQRLSFRLMALTVACGFGVGLVLSLNQIWLDYREEARAMRGDMAAALQLLEEPASEAVYNLDPDLAQHVVQGVASQTGVYEVRLLAYPNERLAELRRPPVQSPWRPLTDAIFGASIAYDRVLYDRRSGKPMGELHVVVDTFQAGRAFLGRALVVLLSGIARTALLALVLLWVFTRWLTRPLNRLAGQIRAVDPNAPASSRLPLPEGHEQDELGVWVRHTNELLEAVERQQAKRMQAEIQAAYMTQFDALTDLPNRTLFYDRATQALYRRRDRRLAMLVCDVRGFHAFNERHGTAAGDAALVAIARALRAGLPQDVTVARLAGDRFGVLLESADRAEAAAAAAQAMMQRVAGLSPIEGQSLRLALAVGIAVYPDDGDKVDALIQNAEKALRQAKLARQGSYQFYYAEMGARIREREQLERDLEAALADGQFALHYQPQVEAVGGRVVGAEALLRWSHPRRGRVAPAQFIPLAEETGLIVPIGRWVLREACRAARSWRTPQPLRVAVNVSAMQVQTPSFCAEVLATLEETGLPASCLELELTESAAVTDLGRTQATLAQVRAAGVQVALDDFGTGHSSLSQLRRIPVNRLKIDQSFVRDVHTDEAKASIVRAIINLGRGLGHRVIAEGVEQPEELAYLLGCACDELQGYLIGPPVSGEQFASRIASNDVLKPALWRHFTGS